MKMGIWVMKNLEPFGKFISGLGVQDKMEKLGKKLV
jgi:hypothetical protein